MLAPIFERFVKKSPVSVMARGMGEHVLKPRPVDQWFEHSAQRHYTQDLLFTAVFGIM